MGACHDIFLQICCTVGKANYPDACHIVLTNKLVFNFFANLIDRVTQKPLFNENTKEMADLVLEGILRGEISDPPGVSFYSHKTNDDGTYMVDKYGLPLYRSFCGTNLAEALHRAMVSSMGHTKSGPRYSDNLLTFVRHMYNWGGIRAKST
jgi:hypothetical protein